MQFNSYIFIFAFLPTVIVYYFLANKIHQLFGKIILILSSLVFYAYSGKTAFIFLMTSGIVNYSNFAIE